MLGAKFLMEEGFKWKVGNKRKINTQQDKWLPTNSGSKVVSVWEVVDQNAMVEDLIDYEIKQYSPKTNSSGQLKRTGFTQLSLPTTSSGRPKEEFKLVYPVERRATRRKESDGYPY
ncbi:hypothetical protein KIW84_056548 [Lathyrus oleraceus]|uniref:Uncharacterized protein n=1 Tax=Pisum sativum TaxID=3888 RepID=A0A9D4X0S8_PEA|nr:hypothetical protein KIW84_056548 [Pisum sativum]